MLSRKFILISLVLTASIATAQIVGPAVTINGVAISREKIQAQVDHLINQRGMNSGGITQPEVYKRIQNEVVDQLIVQELLWQEAQRQEFIVADETVDSRFEELKAGFDREQDFLFRIEEGGFTEESFREDIQQQMSVRQMIAEGIATNILVSDEDVEHFYQTNIEHMRKPIQVHARHILIKPHSTSLADHQEAKKQANAILEEVRAGGDFAELARTRSEGPSASRGGDLGYFGSGQMVAPFEQAAFALEPGQVSDVVQTQFGYHVILLEDKRGGEIASLDEASGRIREYLSDLALQSAVESLVTSLREQGEIEIYVN